MIKPRYYQTAAVEAVKEHTRKNTSACLLELATGAGKSIIVTMLAQFFEQVAPMKKVLCIAPSKELVQQNAEKYKMAGGIASIYCASAGSKCLKRKVVFASPQSIVNAENIGAVSAIIIDEAHGITNSIKKIVDSVLATNDNCRVIGMTATPYRLGTGYIYSIDSTKEKHKVNDEGCCVNPFFNKLLYKITTNELVEQGFLTPMSVGESAIQYDTSALKLASTGKFTADSVKEAVSSETKTARIIQDVLEKTEHSKGVIIYASSLSHAEEIMKLLPEKQSGMVSGDSKKKRERETIIRWFKSKYIKYLVNVDVLTTGFDAPHIDCVAVLRPTESAGLFQQIVGRGLRLSDGKEECLLLDYAENIDRHNLQDDLFNPEIRAKKAKKEAAFIEVTCPDCGMISDKKRRNEKNFDGLKHDKYGYFLIAGTEKVTEWQDGEPCEWDGHRMTIEIQDHSDIDEFGNAKIVHVPMPAHYSRRCSNPEKYIMSGKPVPCEHRFSMKICPECSQENDIAARQCTKCKCRLVEPDKKLVEVATTIKSKSEYEWVEVKKCWYEHFVSSAGHYSIRCRFLTAIGYVTSYITKSQPWIYDKICRMNLFDKNLMDDQYHQCRVFDRMPARIAVSKVINGEYTDIALKKVSDESKEIN